MNPTDRDRRIRTALTPSEGTHVPPGLADDILRRVVATPQVVRRSAGLPAWAVPGGTRSRPPTAMVLLALLLALAAAAVGAVVWLRADGGPLGVTTLYGDPGRTGVMAGPAPHGSPVIAWDVGVTGQLLWLHQPLVSRGVAYAVDARGGVTAMDVRDGTILWRQAVDKVSGTPVLVGDQLVVADVTGTVTAFDRTSGKVRWTRQIGSPTRAALGATDRLVLVGADDGFLHALSVADGKTVWRAAAGGAVIRAPAIAGGVAYLGSVGGRVSAIDLADGTVTWMQELGAVDVGTPVVADSTLYLTSGVEGGPEPYRLVALDAATHAERWTWVAPTLDRVNAAAVVDGSLFVPTTGGELYRLDAATGVGTLLAITAGSLPTMPTWVDGLLVLASDDGTLVAVEADTGAMHWQVTVPGAPTMPIVLDGRIVVGTSLGRVVGLVGGASGPT